MTVSLVQRARRIERRVLTERLRPPPRLTVSQWADRYRVLSPEASFRAGPFVTDDAPYQRAFMDACGDPAVREVVGMFASQLGKTETLNNVVGYHIDQDPAPILVLQPTKEMAEAWSKDRLAPMLRDSPRLRGKVADARARDSGNTITHKALALDTPLPTPCGWTTVGTVQIGDALLDESGCPCVVTDLTPVFRDRPCYRVHFSDGASIVADAGHLWAVERWVVKKRPRPRQSVFRELVTTEGMVGRERAGARFRFAVAMAAPLHLPPVDLPLPPYALGVWLGDGYSHRARAIMAPADAAEVLREIRSEGLDATVRAMPRPNVVEILLEPTGRHMQRGADGRIQPVRDGVLGALRSLGLLSRAGSGASRKAIPPIYLRANEAQRWALLQGLMDTDGSITPSGWCRFVSVLPALADGVCELLTTLGIKWTRSCTASTGAYVISFQSPAAPVFRLTRKRARQRPPTTGATRRRVVAVEPVATVPVRCLTVSSTSHLFLAGRTMVPTHNSFAGGHLTIVGSNSPAGLASRPIRILLEDEIDRYPLSAGSEGDPTAIAESRTSTFPNKKIVKVSSPTVEDGPIGRAWAASDQRWYLVPCPHCGHEQKLVFGGRDTPHGLQWDEGRPETAHYVCAACAAVIEETEKPRMLAQGRWVAENPASPIPGFRLSALYSPFYRWGELVARWLRDKGDPLKLQTFVNTILCEFWVEGGEQLDEHALAAHLEPFPRGGTADVPEPLVPHGVGALTRSVDVQGDRLEMAVWGWGPQDEGWRVDFRIIPGDPATKGPWDELARELTRSYRHQSGAVLPPVPITFVDSGGHHTKQVYDFARTHAGRRVHAIKGSSMGQGVPLLQGPKRHKSARIVTYEVGSYTGKYLLMRLLAKVTAPGPGYIHLPDDLDRSHLDQFLAEKLVTKFVHGRPHPIWVRTGPNEQIDLFVYALAALHALGPRVTDGLAAAARAFSAWARPGPAADAPSPPLAALRRAGRRTGWVNAWRDR